MEETPTRTFIIEEVVAKMKEEEEKKEEKKERNPNDVEVKEEEKIEKVTRPFFIHGRKSNIGPTPQKLIEDNITLYRGIDIWADKNNTDIVYIGREGMNLDEADINCGFPLYPNYSKFIEAEKARMVWVASKTPGQKVYFEGI